MAEGFGVPKLQIRLAIAEASDLEFVPSRFRDVRAVPAKLAPALARARAADYVSRLPKPQL